MRVRKRTWTSGGKQRQAWQVDYTDRSGQRRRWTYATKAEADGALREIAAEIQAGTHAPNARQYTVADALDRYIAALRNGTRVTTNRSPRPQTIEDYQRQIENYVRPGIGEVRLSALDTPTVARFRDWLVTESGAGDRSRQVALQQLKAALDEAKARGLIGADSWSTIKVASSGVSADHDADGADEPPAVIPSEEEIRRLLGMAWAIANGDFSNIWQPGDATWRRYHASKGPRGWKQMQQGMRVYAPMLELATLTGVRQGELRALQVRDVAPRNRELHVRRSLDRKGRVNVTKTDAGDRTVPLPPRAVEILRPFIDGRSNRSWIFTNGNGSPIGKSNLYQRGWVRLLELTQLPRYRFHALRHFFASALIANGASALEVKETLGHANIATTYDIYGHLLRSEEDERRTRVESIANMVGGPTKPTGDARS